VPGSAKDSIGAAQGSKTRWNPLEQRNIGDCCIRSMGWGSGCVPPVPGPPGKVAGYAQTSDLISFHYARGFTNSKSGIAPQPRIAPDGSKRGRGAAGSSAPATRLSGLRSDAGAVDRLRRDVPTNQRGGGARTGDGGCGTGLRTGATAGEGGDAEVLSTAPC
jgi:hypothetical protein